MESIKELFDKDKFASHCGIKIKVIKAGYAECTMATSPNHLNGIGVVMGGAIFSLADFTLSVAANSYGNLAVTLNASISFLKSCSSGIITAVANEISKTNRIGVYKVVLTDEKGEKIAEVMGTCYFK